MGGGMKTIRGKHPNAPSAVIAEATGARAPHFARRPIDGAIGFADVNLPKPRRKFSI
jgi:hypothetical protein